MKREGRLKGMVRTVNILPDPLNPKPTGRILNKVDVPPTAGLFVKVSRKPTNHSKFTGKCERARCSGCHFHPATKSKDKSKGTQKVRSIDNKLSYKVISWTVMKEDRSDKMPVVGYSASRVLDELRDDDNDIDYDDYDANRLADISHDYGYDYSEEDMKGIVGVEVEVDECKEDEIIVHGGVMDDGDDGYQGFFDVSAVVGAVGDDVEGDDGWYFVGGI